MNLHIAAEHQNIEWIKNNLSNFNINELDEFGQNALHIAIDSAFEEAIYEYDVNNQIVSPKTDVIIFLILNGCNFNHLNTLGESPLDWIKQRGNLDFERQIQNIINKIKKKV